MKTTSKWEKHVVCIISFLLGFLCWHRHNTNECAFSLKVVLKIWLPAYLCSVFRDVWRVLFFISYLFTELFSSVFSWKLIGSFYCRLSWEKVWSITYVLLLRLKMWTLKVLLLNSVQGTKSLQFSSINYASVEVSVLFEGRALYLQVAVKLNCQYKRTFY